jgi:hypothetical protein
MNPEALAVSRLDWQFFCTLTFSQESLPERVRCTMFLSWARRAAELAGVSFKVLMWVLRQEAGEKTGRLHFHSLVAGVPPSCVTRTNCFRLMWHWEQVGGGIARVRAYDRALPGVSYVLKGIMECFDGADAYEFSKFRSDASRVTLSDSTLRCIRARLRTSN